MSFPKYDKNLEQTVTGMFNSEGLWYGAPYPPVEILSTPITPRENYLRFYRGEEYAWVPDVGSDVFDITPDCDPDTIACGYSGGLDEFGVKWIPDVSNPELPSFVEPGFCLLEDIADWQTLKMPDVDSWAWEEYAEKYNTALEGDARARRGIIWSGYFERLISIMTFENAAVSLLEDPEAVDAFFSKLDEINIKKADYFLDLFHCDIIMIHDDWSGQRSTFFSPDVAMNLIAPHVRKLADHVHSKGALFELHSCGNGVTVIPAIKAAGADSWQAQEDSFTDWETAYDACGDDLILETYSIVPDDVDSDEKMNAYIESEMKKHCGKHRGLHSFMDFNFERCLDTRKLVYEYSRKMAQDIV